MIDNLETQLRWVSRNKPYLPDKEMLDSLMKKEDTGIVYVPVSVDVEVDKTSVPTRLEKRAGEDIESDDELDRLLSKRPRNIHGDANRSASVGSVGNNSGKSGEAASFNGNVNRINGHASVDKMGSVSAKNHTSEFVDTITTHNGTSSAQKNQNQTVSVQKNQTGSTNSNQSASFQANQRNSVQTNHRNSSQAIPNGSFHANFKSPADLTPSNQELYEKYINCLELKCELLRKRYTVSESSSMSLDQKNRFIHDEFTPKYSRLERIILQTKRRLPQFTIQPASQIEELEEQSGTSASTSEVVDFTSVSTPAPAPVNPVVVPRAPENIRQPPEQPVEVIPAQAEVHDVQEHPQTIQVQDSLLSDDFSDFEITQVQPAKPLIQLSSEPDIPQVAIPRTPDHSDAEDEFGGREMEGLRTPTQEIDDAETDLSGFVVEDEESSEESDIESIEESIRVDRDELDDIMLSQDVAEQYGINYDDLELGDDFINTQLNDERELNYEVIEISDEDEDYYSNRLIEPPVVKQEKTGAKPDDFDDFDDFDDDLLEMGITTSKDIILEQQRNFPGYEHYVKEIYSVLNKKFELQNFRSNQFDAIISLLQGKDVFVLMPTGGGKSLCYQLTALVKVGERNQGVTVVISPLISLMQDQVEHLKAKNIRAGMINSKMEYQEKKQIIELFRTAQLDLVYLSPEMVNSSSQIQRIIKYLYDSKLLNKFVVDEAHCISSWGHDFRPDYKALSLFRTQYPDISIMALTATANEKVRLDITHLLHMNEPKILKQSFNRINLYYEIRMKTSGYIEDIKTTIVGGFNNQTGIIYCNSKNLCEQISMKLNQAGLKTSFYHAGMSTEDRFKVQADWQKENIRVICATIAFGMGIDKPNVRFVIHAYLPRNLEGYYQETGRAGRDGLKSTCIMYYSYKDARNLQLMIQKDEEYNEVTKENHLNKLRQVIQFCENNHDCRRKQVLRYFNEDFDPKNCMKQCDACNNTNKKEIAKNFTEMSKSILRLVERIQNDRVTLLYCQDVFKGSNNAKITKNGHNLLEYHGMGKSLSKLEVERIFFHLICEECLVEYSIIKGGFASNYVKVGPNAGPVWSGNKTIIIKFSESAASSSANIGNAVNKGNMGGFVSAKTNQPIRLPQNNLQGLVNRVNEPHIEKCFNELNLIRNSTRNELNFQNANNILSNEALKKLAIMLPTSKQEFKKYVANNDQLNYFIYFKSKLTQLSQERKRIMSIRTGTQPSSSTNSSVSGAGRKPTRPGQKPKHFKRPHKKRLQKAMPM